METSDCVVAIEHGFMHNHGVDDETASLRRARAGGRGREPCMPAASPAPCTVWVPRTVSRVLTSLFVVVQDAETTGRGRSA